MPLTYTTSDAVTGTTVVAADVNSRFDEVKSKFAAGIVNGDISTAAAISVDKLDAQYEHMLVPFHMNNVGTTDMVWPAAGVVIMAIPIPNDGKGAWTVSAAELVCSDVGADDSQVRFEWGRYTAGTWGVTTTVVSAVAINSDDSAANTAGHQSLTIASGTLAVGTHRCLAMVSAAVGTTATFDAVDSYIAASFHLYRKIANG
jgi:hypothetical protein